MLSALFVVLVLEPYWAVADWCHDAVSRAREAIGRLSVQMVRSAAIDALVSIGRSVAFDPDRHTTVALIRRLRNPIARHAYRRYFRLSVLILRAIDAHEDGRLLNIAVTHERFGDFDSTPSTESI